MHYGSSGTIALPSATATQEIIMPRRSRIVVPGCAHHVTQRGNHQTNVFFDNEDRHHYFELLGKNLSAYSVRLWAYCLMTNHIHAIAVPPSETALSEMFRNIHSAYGLWFNRKYRLSGHLWQGRFYSCVLGDSHLWPAVRYVERNPVRAGVVKRAEEHPWSSAFAHVFGREDPLLDAAMPLTTAVGNWSEWLSAEDVDSEIRAIRMATAHDLPYGEESLVERLELQFGRPLRPRKEGRKSKSIQSGTIAPKSFTLFES